MIFLVLVPAYMISALFLAYKMGWNIDTERPRKGKGACHE